MANKFYLAPTTNYIQKNLSGAIDDSTTTITLNNTTNLTAPGYIVINRKNSAETATPNDREVVSYTGISGSDLTNCVRGEDSSTAREHGDNSIVEAILTIGMWNNLATIVATGFTSDGYLKAIPSPVSVARMHVETHIEVSAASVTGLGLSPVWVHTGNYSGPTTLMQTPITMTRAGTWEYFNVITRTVASTSSVMVDVNKNGTSIFDTIGRPGFLPAATFASTASIKTKGFVQGDRFSVDIDLPAAGEDGHVTDFTVIGKAI